MTVDPHQELHRQAFKAFDSERESLIKQGFVGKCALYLGGERVGVFEDHESAMTSIDNAVDPYRYIAKHIWYAPSIDHWP